MIGGYAILDAPSVEEAFALTKRFLEVHGDEWDKYQPHDQDALLGQRVAEALGVPGIRSEMVLEGGAVAVDGESTLVTTESCLLNPNRNAGWSKADIEAELKRVLGVGKVIWLPGDPAETETDGHIDGLLAFAAPGKVLLELATDPDDPRAFPGRAVIMLPIGKIATGGGGFHCITQQQPALS